MTPDQPADAAPTLTDNEITLRRRQDDPGPVVTFAVGVDGIDGPVGLVEVRRGEYAVGLVSWTTYPRYRRRRYASRAVRMLAAYAFTELGLERLQAQLHPRDLASTRVAVLAGFRREGVLRGNATTPAGDRHDTVVYGLRRDDPAPDTVLGWTSQMDSLLPRKRVIAHVLVRDTTGRILLCTTGFKRDLELPGGVVEPDEDPLAGARREVAEELGVDLPVGGVVAIDWLPPWQGWGDAIELLYDGGVHDPVLLDTLTVDGREILAADWYPVDQLDGRVSPLNARRLPSILAEPGRVHQLRDGRPT